jgi:hypothetical protein
MFRSLFLSALLLAGLAGATHAVGPPPVEPISEAMLRRHIEVLASDEFEGRKAGTEGEQKAIAYISRAFEALGAVPDGPDGGWLQPVPLVERTPGEAQARLHFTGGSIILKADQLIATTRDEHMRLRKLPLLFGGFGHQLEQADVKNRMVMVLSDPPPGEVKPVVMSELRMMLAKRGAAGMIMIAPASAGWGRIHQLNRGSKTVLASDPVLPASVIIPREAADALAVQLGTGLEEWTRRAGLSDFRPAQLPVRFQLNATTRVRPFSAYNVVARLRGRASNGAGNLAGAILLAAHHDHLGICAPPEAKDRICNGAVDNASGVSMMIEVARQLAQGERPQRDVILLATGAEELGLLGARHYVATHPEARDQLAAMLNMDTVAVAPRGMKLGVIGRGLTALDPLIDRVARDAGREVDDRNVHNGLVRRQDAWAFLQAGIPAVMVGGFFTEEGRLKAFFDKPYHLPEDDLRYPIELGGATEDAGLTVRLARVLADPAQLPRKSPVAP